MNWLDQIIIKCYSDQLFCIKILIANRRKAKEVLDLDRKVDFPRNPACEARAKRATNHVRAALDISSSRKVPIGVFMGTGWSGRLQLDLARTVPFAEVPGFDDLPKVSGHKKEYLYGYIGKTGIIVADGRVHSNEDPSNQGKVTEMVRLQTDVMMHLGVKKLIITCGAGSLPGCPAVPGDLVLINRFMSTRFSDQPLWGGEFADPDSVLTEWLRNEAKDIDYPGQIHEGVYGIVKGPGFEGLVDKHAIARDGVHVIGMSTFTEACVAACYDDVEALGLAFVTNGYTGTHSHEANKAKAQECSEALGSYLSQIITRLA